MAMSPQHIIDCRKFEAKAALLYARNFSTYAIAKQLDCSQGKVAHALRRINMPRRSKSEAAKLGHQ